jgi:putative ABC transport system permease protein
MARVGRWIHSLLRPLPAQSDRAIADEIQSHVALHADELIAAGQSPEIARRNALISLGGFAQTVDRCQERRRFAAVRTLTRDLQLAVRRLLHEPLFTFAAVATLALGIGATSAIFSVARTALASPLPYRDASRRVLIFSKWTAFQKTTVADQEIWDYRSMAHTLSGIAGWTTGQENLTGAGRPARLTVGRVTANTFDVLGVSPWLGRGFTDAEDRPHGPPVVILGYELWRARFGGDQSVIGHRVVLDDVPVEVIGVMPRTFRLPTDYTDDVTDPTEAWRPLQIDESRMSRSHGYYAAARLAPGQTARTASDELAAIARQLTREGQYRETMHFTAFARTFDDEIRGPMRPTVWLLTAGVLCLLLIACANVGNLLMVRGETRQRELALRAALGASGPRLLRDLILEALVLSFAGAAIGLPFAIAGLAVVRAFDPSALEALGSLSIHWQMMLVSVGAATFTTVLFSASPIVGHHAIVRILRDAGANATATRGRSRLRRLLVMLEVGVATVLLVAAGLTIRSVEAMRRVDLGFAPERMLTMRVALPPTRYATADQIVDFYRRASEGARVLPGVEAAGVVRLLPLATTIGDWGLDVDGFDETAGNAKGDWQVVTDGAFEAMGTRLQAGRWFDTTDGTETEPVAVVNQTLARTYWHKPEDAVGGRIRLGSDARRPWIRVVGIVADERHNGITETPKEKFYIPFSQWHVVTAGNVVRNAFVIVRTTGDPLASAKALENVVQQIDPDLPVSAPRAMTDVVSTALATPRLTGFLLSSFAAIALLLSAVGIYGVLAYVVSRRTREIGIRIALGSGRPRVVGLIVRQGITLALAGVCAGGLVALGFSGVLRGLLYQIEPTDATTFAAVAAILLLIALTASALPAWRAGRMSPLVALKSE